MALGIGLGVRHVENGQPPLYRFVRCVELQADSINGGFVARVVKPDGTVKQVQLSRAEPKTDIERGLIYLMQSGTDGSLSAFVSASGI
ncbi:MAG: hypothetical protein WC734_00530 [Patescibacteria group bacterium]|jgi:hypothetical protein